LKGPTNKTLLPIITPGRQLVVWIFTVQFQEISARETNQYGQKGMGSSGNGSKGGWQTKLNIGGKKIKDPVNGNASKSGYLPETNWQVQDSKGGAHIGDGNFVP